MIRIFICPKCYNFRMVSRKPNAMCFHCGARLEKSDLDYNVYIQMTEQDRSTYRENYKKRMLAYHEKLNNVLQGETVIR